jgi:hypothetical protein
MSVIKVLLPKQNRKVSFFTFNHKFIVSNEKCFLSICHLGPSVRLDSENGHVSINIFYCTNIFSDGF